eukprot:5056744-Pleurochrysis_carterae.AAC.1
MRTGQGDAPARNFAVMAEQPSTSGGATEGRENGLVPMRGREEGLVPKGGRERGSCEWERARRADSCVIACESGHRGGAGRRDESA